MILENFLRAHTPAYLNMSETDREDFALVRPQPAVAEVGLLHELGLDWLQQVGVSLSFEPYPVESGVADISQTVGVPIVDQQLQGLIQAMAGFSPSAAATAEISRELVSSVIGVIAATSFA